MGTVTNTSLYPHAPKKNIKLVKMLNIDINPLWKSESKLKWMFQAWHPFRVAEVLIHRPSLLCATWPVPAEVLRMEGVHTASLVPLIPSSVLSSYWVNPQGSSTKVPITLKQALENNWHYSHSLREVFTENLFTGIEVGHAVSKRSTQKHTAIVIASGG